MDAFSIDQGTVIYGIRSTKYPTIPCYGVIITARCDIAQRKVPKYYFLVAVDASDWFCTEHGYELVYSGTIKNLKNDINCKANELDLNGEVLISLDSHDLEAILSAKREECAGNRKNLQKVENLSSKIAEYNIYSGKKMTDSKRSEAIYKHPQTAVKELEKIYKGEQSHYYFLPQHAYLKNSVFSTGLIVDLLEIGELSLKDAEKMKSPGIDYQILPKRPTPEEMIEIINMGNQQQIEGMFSDIQETIRLTSTYWLKDDSDFVGFEGTIQSPWCEHLMQRFSNAFIRIGIIDPTPEDYKTVIARCYKEVTEQ